MTTSTLRRCAGPASRARVAQKDLFGGSFQWWPPRGDHILLYRANPLRFRFFDRYLPDWTGVRILDVGCGGGYCCEYLARRNAIVFGTDLLPEALEEARAHAALEDLQIKYSVCSTTRLPHGDATMDVVTCFDVFEHVPDKRVLLAEIFRVLRPGGWVFFDTLNRTCWSWLVAILLGEIVLRLIPRRTHDWRHFIRPQALTELLDAAGFGRPNCAGLTFDLSRWRSGGLPFRVNPRGKTAIMYFGAARKSGAEGDRTLGLQSAILALCS